MTQNIESKRAYRVDKYSIIVTICFFLIASYVAFFHHNYWTFDVDGIYYLLAGQEILSGNEENVVMLHAPVGGSILFASLNLVFNDGFSVIKAISVLSATGMVFFSFYIIRNFFDTKTSLLGQLFFALNPWVFLFAIQARNEILPVFLVMAATFFITKKDIKLHDVIIIGCLVGAATEIRYQSAFILVAFVVFLLIRNKKIRTNLVYAALLVLLFTAAASPALLYNYFTYGVILDSDPNFELMVKSKYKPPNEIIEEFKQKIANDEVTDTYGDPNLFLKNYFYNLFNHNPNKLFNFDTISNLSPIPTIPFLGLILVFGSLFYLLKIQLDRKNLMVSAGIFFGTLFSVLLFGDINIHFFALIILPIIGLTILNFNKIENNLLPVLVAPAVYLVLISIIPVSKPEHLLPVWIMIPALSSVFFIHVIPRMISKITNTYKSPIKEL